MASVLLCMLRICVKYGLNNPGRCLLVGILFQTFGTSAANDFRGFSSIHGNLTEGKMTQKPSLEQSPLNQLAMPFHNQLSNRSLLTKSRLPRGVGPNKPDSIRDVTDKLKVLQDKYNNLKARVTEMESSGVGLDSVLNTKKDLESDMAELTRRVDDIKQNLDQTYKSTIERIVNQLQSLQSQVNAMNDEMLQKFGDVYAKFKKADEDKERTTVRDLVAAIVDGQLETALSKCAQLREIMTDAGYYGYIRRIIQEAARNSRTSFDSMNNFIRGLTYIDELIMGYLTLLEEMKVQNKLFTPEIMQVGYRIKEIMEMSNYPKIGRVFKESVELMKASLPACVRRILWEDVCLSNKQHTGGWLIASNVKYDSDRRYVTKAEDERKDKWKFETPDGGKYFLIKNLNVHKEYLYAANEYFKFNAEKRRVFTWKTRENFVNFAWRIEPLDNESIRIKNREYNEYLFCSNWGLTHGSFYDGKNVLTWMTGGAERDAEWIVHQC